MFPFTSSTQTASMKTSNQELNTSPYSSRLQKLTNGYGFLLGFDDPTLHDADLKLILRSLFPNRESVRRYSRLLRDTIEDILSDEMEQVDIQDAINRSCAQWVSETICPLPKEQTLGEFYEMLSYMHSFVFCTYKAPAKEMTQKKALEASAYLSKHIDKQLRLASLPIETRGKGFFRLVWGLITEPRGKTTVGRSASREFLRRIPRIADEEAQALAPYGWIKMRDRFGDLIKKEYPDLEAVDFDKDSEKLVASIRKEAWSLKLQEKDIQERVKWGFQSLIDMDYSRLTLRPNRDDLNVDYRRLTLRPNRDDLDELSESDFLALVKDPSSKGHTTAPTKRGPFFFQKRNPEKTSRRHLVTQRIMFENRVQELRLIANVLGLCIMSVTLARACTQSVIFYLLKKHNSKDPGWSSRVPDMKEIIRQSSEFQHPLVPFSMDSHGQSKDDDLGIKIGYRLAQFSQPRGIGLHKCPVSVLIDEAMPEALAAIFRLEDLRLPEDSDVIEAYNVAQTQEPMRHRPSLILPRFDPRIIWRGGHPPLSMKLKALRRGSNIVLFLLGLVVLCIIFHIFGLLLETIPDIFTSTVVSLDCSGPTEIFDPYHDVVLRPGRDGKPLPIELVHRSRKPYRVSVIDVDKRDLRLELSVDGDSKGFTRDFFLDKSMDCGENLRECLSDGYSAGVIIVPPGKHTVKIEWAGKEYIEGTQDIDWGGDYTRRFKLQREYCSQIADLKPVP